jgi:hypothetical protein
MPRCLNCKSKFTPTYFLAKFCNDEKCLDASIQYARAKVKQNASKVWQKEKQTLKTALKTLTDWNNDLQKEVNLIVRLIDKGHPCISSQRPLNKSADAGHLYSRGSNPQIRFHLFNIFAQSVHDNQWKSGNVLDFVNGIELIFGIEIKDYCLSLKGLKETKLTVDDLKEKISIARSIVKWLKLQDRIFTNADRIELRKEFNLKLGIYK